MHRSFKWSFSFMFSDYLDGSIRYGAHLLKIIICIYKSKAVTPNAFVDEWLAWVLRGTKISDLPYLNHFKETFCYLMAFQGLFFSFT
jgi:hypothetical protein